MFFIVYYLIYTINYGNQAQAVAYKKNEGLAHGYVLAILMLTVQGGSTLSLLQ
jgi:hypothetical protein